MIIFNDDKKGLVFTSKGVVFGSHLLHHSHLSHQQPSKQVLQVQAEVSWLDDKLEKHLYLYNSVIQAADPLDDIIKSSG